MLCSCSDFKLIVERDTWSTGVGLPIDEIFIFIDVSKLSWQIKENPDLSHLLTLFKSHLTLPGGVSSHHFIRSIIKLYSCCCAPF